MKIWTLAAVGIVMLTFSATPSTLSAQITLTRIAVEGSTEAPQTQAAITAVDPDCGHCHEDEEISTGNVIHQMTDDEPGFVACEALGGGHMIHDCDGGDGSTWTWSGCDSHGECGQHLASTMMMIAAARSPQDGFIYLAGSARAAANSHSSCFDRSILLMAEALREPSR